MKKSYLVFLFTFILMISMTTVAFASIIAIAMRVCKKIFTGSEAVEV
mgnify:CR=1 FL=1